MEDLVGEEVVEGEVNGMGLGEEGDRDKENGEVRDE